MFKDYYLLVGISPSASKQEIKNAYRNLSLRWHPDRNPGVNVTEMMQDINEAYKILYNDVSRVRYYKEYKKFAQRRDQSRPQQEEVKQESWNYDYEVNDDELRNDINEARRYAKDLVDDFFRNIKETSKVAAKGAWNGAYGYILGGILVSIVFTLIKACH